jgi:hypothetical protein
VHPWANELVFEPQRSKPFKTISQPVVTIVILAVAAGVGLAAYHFVSRRNRASKVRAELPIIYRAVVEQRGRLVAAISAYKKAYGFYPPDHILSTNPITVETVTNQLFYELVGCVFDQTQQVWHPNGSSERLPPGLVRKFFGRDFTNGTNGPFKPIGFLSSDSPKSLIVIHEKPEMIGLMTYWPNWEGFDGDASAFEIGTWQYNSSAPQHNPAAYDLWLRISTEETNLVIGNW